MYLALHLSSFIFVFFFSFSFISSILTVVFDPLGFYHRTYHQTPGPLLPQGLTSDPHIWPFPSTLQSFPPLQLMECARRSHDGKSENTLNFEV